MSSLATSSDFVRVDVAVLSPGVAPAIFIRAHSLEPVQTGYLLGAVTLIASIGGVLASGWLNGWLQQRGRLDAPMTTGAIGALGVVLSIALLPVARELGAAVALFASLPVPPSTAVIQFLAPNRMRSPLSAMFSGEGAGR
jgi:hypothetical protein